MTVRVMVPPLDHDWSLLVPSPCASKISAAGSPACGGTLPRHLLWHRPVNGTWSRLEPWCRSSLASSTIRCFLSSLSPRYFLIVLLKKSTPERRQSRALCLRWEEEPFFPQKSWTSRCCFSDRLPFAPWVKRRCCLVKDPTHSPCVFCPPKCCPLWHRISPLSLSCVPETW